MRHICVAITICTAASLSVGFAQDIPSDLSAALAAEWKTPASTLHCLAALGIYTTYTPAGYTVPLSPPDAAGMALKELLAGVPASDADLYTVAQQRPDFLDQLAKANKLNPTPAQEDSLFMKASDLIQTIYMKTPDGKQNLAEVQASSAQSNNYLALFQLLNAYPRPQPVTQDYADSLEILRACYKMNAERLFKLVRTKVLGQS